MQRRFDDQIAQLQQELLLMSGRAEAIVRKSVESLMRRDPTLADEVMADDKIVDRMEIDLEERCVQLLALQQPLARDLRLITSALKISNDLERVGDHAVNIAECTKRTGRQAAGEAAGRPAGAGREGGEHAARRHRRVRARRRRGRRDGWSARRRGRRAAPAAVRRARSRA
jgi:hypothetical protein